MKKDSPIPQTPEQKLISDAMRLLGSRKTPKKAAASKRNAKLGGRPKKLAPVSLQP